jgi:hypothetical protein
MVEEAGGAWIGIHPDTSKFASELTGQIKPALAQVEALAAASGKKIGASLGGAGKTGGTGLTTGLKAGLAEGERAATTSIGRIVASLKGAGSQFLSAFGGGSSPLGGLLTKTEEGVKGVTAASGTGTLGMLAFGAAGVAAAAGIVVALKGAADAASEYEAGIRKVAATTGSTSQEASLLVAELHHVGIETDTGAKGFQFLGRNIENNKTSFSRWFSNSDQAVLKSGDLSKALPLLSEKFNGLGTAAEKTTFLMDVFGRGGVALRPLLSLTADQIDAVAKRAGDLGLIFSSNQLAQAKDYKYAMNDLGEAFSSLKITAGETVIPMLTDISKGISGFLARVHQFGPNLKQILGIGQLLPQVGDPAVMRQAINSMLTYHATIEDVSAAFQKADGDWEITNQILAEQHAQVAANAGTFQALSDEEKKAADSMISDWNKAASAWETTLGKLVPADFSGVIKDAAQAAKDTSVANAQAAVDSASSAVDTAQKRLDQLNQRIAAQTAPAPSKTAAGQAAQEAAANRQQIADQQAIANATDAVTAAKDRQTTSSKKLSTAQADQPTGDLLTGLQKSLGDSATQLTQFDALIPQLQRKLVNLGRDPEVVDAFLSRLNDMGVDAVPLLQRLVTSSGKTLGGLVDVTGKQVNAAKAAADFHFNKWPANFREKMGAAVAAAGDQLDSLVGQYEAIPDKTSNVAIDLGAQIQGVVGNLLDLEAQGSVTLPPFLHDLLTAAATAQKPDAAVQLLLGHLKELDATFRPTIVLNDTQVRQELNDLASWYAANPAVTATIVGPVPVAPGSTSILSPQAQARAALAPVAPVAPPLGSGLFIPPALAPAPVPTTTTGTTGIVRMAAAGGIATRPTWVLAAEAGRPEAFIPLENADRIKAMGADGPTIGNVNVTVHQLDPTSYEIADAIGRKVGWVLAAGR